MLYISTTYEGILIKGVTRWDWATIVLWMSELCSLSNIMDTLLQHKYSTATVLEHVAGESMPDEHLWSDFL